MEVIIFLASCFIQEPRQDNVQQHTTLLYSYPHQNIWKLWKAVSTSQTSLSSSWDIIFRMCIIMGSAYLFLYILLTERFKIQSQINYSYFTSC